MFKTLAFIAVMWLTFAVEAQTTLTFTSGVQKYAALSDATVNLSGRCELWVTNASTPLAGCTINLNSVDAWLFLPGVKPSVVASTYLSQVFVRGVGAAAGSNVRVAQYGQDGAIVIPESATFQPLTVFSEPEFGGAATSCSQWTYYTGSGIGSVSSFILKRGYQAVIAQSADGISYSQCYVAQDGDLEVGVLPSTLDKQVKFIYVTPWRWTAKKGIAGDPGISQLNVNWWYDWNLDQSSSKDLEYVAIRQTQYWPSLSQNWQSLGINTVLGYNEPDNASQADLSVSAAIADWGDLLGTGLRVGSPATTDGGRSSWLYPFVVDAGAAGLRVDFVAIHYYQAHDPTDAAGCATQLYDFLLDIWNNTHRPIWVTEWNNGANWTDNDPYPVPTYAQQQACISAMINMLESTPFVERYALYNWVEDPRSVVTNGVLTGAGESYSNLVSNLSYAQAMPDNDTRGIAQYLFATNTWDTSGYGNNALAVGAPAFATGHNNQAQAIVLDGANSYLQLPANLAQANGFTFAAWVYWNGGANWQRIFDFGDDTSHYLFLTPSSSSGTLRFAINDGSGEQILETNGLASGAWRHVAVTLNGDTVTLYVNGTHVATATNFSIAPSAFTPFKNYLGKSQFPADPLFAGKLDEVEIADYALTAAQISALYTTVPSPVSPYNSGVWTNDANGTWSTTNNWNDGLVANGGNGVNYSADFSTINLTADRTVTLDSARSIGGLRFGDPAGSQDWTVAGTSVLTLDTGASNAPAIAVNENTTTISVPLAGSHGFVKGGSGTLILNASNALTGVVSIDSSSATTNDGVVRVTNPGALANASGIQMRDSGNGSSTLQLDDSGGANVAEISMNGRNNTVPAIENMAGTNSLADGIGVYGNGRFAVQVDAGALDVGGTITTSDGGSDTITFQGDGLVNLTGVVADGSGMMSVNQAGTGTLLVGPGSAYSGLTTISQGVLALQSTSLSGPVLHFTFNNAAGSGNGSIITNSGSGGAAMNGKLISPTGAAIIAGGGRFGDALSLSGTGSNSFNNLVIVSNKVLNTDAAGNWTVCFWIKTSTTGAVVMYQGDGTWSSAGQTTFYLNNDGTTAGTHAGAVRWAGGWLTGTAALNNDAWHLVALVDRAGTESIYVDGNVDAVASTMADPLASDANQIWIGGSPDGGDGATKMAGLIDEVYMFNRALSQTEVQSLYNLNTITNSPRNILPAAATVNVGAAGTLDLAGIPQTLGGLDGGGLVTNSGAATTLTVSNASGATLFSGTVGDASAVNTLSLTKNGAGIFILAGSNTYHGSTVVNGGTLKLSPLTDDAVLHLAFNNAAGSGNGTVITNLGLGGAAMNGTLISTNGGAVIQTGGRFGGNALTLNGSGGNALNNLVLVTNKVLNTDASGSWTVGYWIKTSTAGAAIMYQGDGAWASAGQTSFYLNNDSTTAGTHAGAVRWAGGWLTGKTALNNNVWHFVTLVDNAGMESIYVDGNLDSVASLMANPLARDADQVWIGGSPDGGDGAAKMSGMIDEVYMFNRALSQTEVQLLYANNSFSTNTGNVLPVTTTVNVASGTTWDVGGVSPTIAALTGSGLVMNTGHAATLTVSNNAGTVTFSGRIADASAGNALSLVQSGGATITLSGANTYRGTTTINGGSLFVNGAIGLGAVTVSNGLLGGNGVIGGAVTVQAGGTLAPGGGLTALTVNNGVSLLPGSTTVLEISETAQTNDQLVVAGALTCGGALVITNLAGTLGAGDNFQLFQAGSINGSFSSNSLPALPTGLAWGTANLSYGILSVVATTPTQLQGGVSGANLNLSWPADHTGWRLQVQTNPLGVGLSANWVDVPSSILTNNLIIPLDANEGSVFYRLVLP